MFKFLKRKFTDEKIYKILGRKVHLRNGVGYGFISSPELYDNGFIEIGFGRVVSGYGDWGGGFDRAATSALKVVVDKNLVIQSLKTDSYYNSESSKKTEKHAKQLIKNVKVGDTLVVNDSELKRTLDALFAILPIKSCVSWQAFEHPHMLEKHTSEDNFNYYRDMRNPKNVEFIHKEKVWDSQ